MTLENVNNIEGLFEVINKCKGKVELVSDDGDQINLKSRLAQYLAIAGVFSNGHIKEMELRIENEDDRKKILEFVMSGKSLEGQNDSGNAD